jgi:excinuclease ABC subunit C
LRDEAHRFAITYHKNVRAKQAIRSSLDKVPGIGPKKRHALIKEFGSVRGVREATIEELTAVSGITPKIARQIKDNL